MITTDGKRHIKRFIGGSVPTIGGTIAYGLGNKATTVNDAYLQFEFGRAPITLVSYDVLGDVAVFKATVPENVSGTIYEVALYSQNENQLADGFGSRLITTFDQDTEVWSSGTWQSTNSRIGGDSLRLAPAVSATVTTELTSIILDFMGNSGADKFLFAYHNLNTNTASIQVRFVNDSANYYTYTISNPGVGYQVAEIPKGSFTAVGTPWWNEIMAIQVIVTAKATGAAQVDLDGIRLEDVDTINPDYVLVAREVLAVPYSKLDNQTDEIEFRLAVNIT